MASPAAPLAPVAHDETEAPGMSGEDDAGHSSSGDLEKSEHAAVGTVLPAGKAEPSQQSAPAGPPGGPPPVPDGGLQAWLQVLGAWMLFFNTWGILNTFGIFQTYYESGALFEETSSNIAWIGAINAFLLLFVSLFTGPIFDRGYLRTLLVLGSFLTVFGYMMLSLCKEFWQVILAQGFTIGIGGGCLFVPAVSVMPGYFRRHIGLALGIAASGSSMGGVIYPIVFYKLIDRIDFGWTTRVLGFIALATLLIPIAVMKQRIKPPKARDLIDWTVFHDLPFLLAVLASFFGFIGLYTAIFYISYFGLATGVADYTMSFYIVPILNAASVFGRTLPNYLSDYTGPYNIVGPGAIIVGIAVLCMMAVDNLGGYVVEAIVLGFFTGIYVALPPVCFAQLTRDKSKIGTRLGMAFGAVSFSVLVGGPGVGAIIGNDAAHLHWNHAFIFGGIFSVASGVLFLVLRFRLSEGKLLCKV